MRLLCWCILIGGCDQALVSSAADLARPPVDLAGVDLSGAAGDLAMTPGDRSPLGFAKKLGRTHFLVGMGNDGTDSGNDPAYNLGPTLDLHDHYLVGLSTQGGWTTWNSNPDYAGKRINEAVAHGVVPMLTYYAMIGQGENNLPASIGSASYMMTWWKDYAQLLSTANAANTPVVIHVEPDYWGYLQHAAIDAGSPGGVPAKVAASGAAECHGLPENAIGFGKCIIAMTRTRAPKALVGFHASGWSSKMDALQNPGASLDVVAEAQKTVTFLKAVGADQADFIATDLLDRDAGCYEVGLKDAIGNTICGVRQGLYWDESNQKLPHFHQAWAWCKAVAEGLDLPLIWWQLPFGAPSAMAGGTPGHFRDNRVHYLFAHIDELIAAHGVGMAFGTGAEMQTSVGSDSDEFKTAVTAFFANPNPLP